MGSNDVQPLVATSEDQFCRRSPRNDLASSFRAKQKDAIMHHRCMQQVDPTQVFREPIPAKTPGDLASLDADACAAVVTMFGRHRAKSKSTEGGMRDLKVHATALDLTKVRRRAATQRLEFVFDGAFYRHVLAGTCAAVWQSQLQGHLGCRGVRIFRR